MFKYDIISQILSSSYGVRSYSKKLHKQIIDEDWLEKIAEIVLDTTALSMIEAKPVLQAARKISSRVHRLLELEEPADYSLLKFGCDAIHWVAEAGLIDVEKVAMRDNAGKDQWFITSTSKDYSEYAQSILPKRSMLSPIEGYREWLEPEMRVGSHYVPMVKKAKRYGLTDNYTYDKMPLVYKALNRLGKQGFEINTKMLDLCYTDFSFIPSIVSEGQRKLALISINDVTRKAKFIEEIRFKEMNQWLLEEAEMDDEALAEKISKKRASEKSQDWYDTNVEQHSDIISQWSKRMDFEKTVQLAVEWNGSTINYLFNQCTRGRIYAVQNYLTPLGADYAKALLVFDEKHQVSGYDLCIHIANCFGQDKLSFGDRVKWVNENSEALRHIGTNPSASDSQIKDLDLYAETKTRWQGIAAAIVYADYCDYMEEYETEEGFVTNLIIGLDATSSGTQILTLLGADDRVAPYVNLTKPVENRVGDFYTFLSNYLKPKLDEHRGESETLDAVLNNWPKMARKIAKRNSMTFVYSGTKFGFGQQHWEDRHSYGEIGSNLVRSDCRVLGNEMYDVCSENIRGGAEIMKWLRDGIDYVTDGAIVSWVLPDGFTAFQACDRSKKNSIDTTIGTRNVSLAYYTFQDKPKKVDHKNAISPNFVHSEDAYLLRLIVLGLPEEAPVSTVHDQFSTTSYYIQDLQETAKTAYKTVGNRQEAERMAEEAFGTHRELPIVGTYNINQIDEAEFIIC